MLSSFFLIYIAYVPVLTISVYIVNVPVLTISVYVANVPVLTILTMSKQMACELFYIYTC